MERGLPVDPSRRDRARGGALHQRVEIGLVPHVERARGSGAERDAQDRGEAEHRVDRLGRDEQAAQRR